MGLFKASYGKRKDYDLLQSKDSEILYVCYGADGTNGTTLYKDGLFIGNYKVAVNGHIFQKTEDNTLAANTFRINIDGIEETVCNKSYIDSLFHWEWKGDITVANLQLETGYQPGWAYRITGTAGTINGTRLEPGDIVVAKDSYQSSFSIGDFIIWERNLNGAVQIDYILNNNTYQFANNGNGNVVIAASGDTVYAIANPTTAELNIGSMFLNQTAATGQMPTWQYAIIPSSDHFSGSPLRTWNNHGVMIGDNKFSAHTIGTGNNGNILYSKGSSNDPDWLSNPSTPGVLVFNTTNGTPAWLPATTNDNGKVLKVSVNNGVITIGWDTDQTSSGGGGGATYDLNNDNAGYIEFNSSAAATKHVNVFQEFSNSPYSASLEGLILYDPIATSANGGTGVTEHAEIQQGQISIIPSTSSTNPANFTSVNGGIMFFEYKDPLNAKPKNTVAIKQILSLNDINGAVSGTVIGGQTMTGAGRTEIPSLGSVYDAMCWGSF